MEETSFDMCEKEFHLACDAAVSAARRGDAVSSEKQLNGAKSRLNDLQLEVRMNKDDTSLGIRFAVLKEKMAATSTRVRKLIDETNRDALLSSATVTPSGSTIAAPISSRSAADRARAADATAKLQTGTASLVDSHRRVVETTSEAEAILEMLSEQRKQLKDIHAKAVDVKDAATEGEKISKRMNSLMGWFS